MSEREDFTLGILHLICDVVDYLPILELTQTSLVITGKRDTFPKVCLEFEKVINKVRFVCQLSVYGFHIKP